MATAMHPRVVSRQIGNIGTGMFRPDYITFDCYGTLTRFRISDMARDFFKDRVAADRIDAFLADFSAYRFDDVLGAWKPYTEVIHDSLRRTCKSWGVEFRPAEARAIYEAVPSWGPHADVAEPLATVAKHIPLVILSNASNSQIHDNVAKLGAPFHAVYTAEQAQAYKPRFRAFEYMLDQLNCPPERVLHVSASLRYDLMSAHDLHFGGRVFVDRGYDPGNEAYGYARIENIGGLPALVGL
jgi:2-haloacid dehalogenase